MIQAPPHIQATTLDLDLSDTHLSAARSLLAVSDTHITIDITQPGKQHGHLVMSLPGSGSAPAQLRIPVCCIRGPESGPTVTMIGGIHGDEYEGPLVLNRMARGLETESVYGCLILVPCLNVSGLKAGQRCLGLAEEDLDSCFPGKAEGSPGERLAHEIFERLIRPADLVLDLRSGGSSLDFEPSAAVRFMGVSNQQASNTREQELVEASEAAMIAFGAPNSVRFPPSGPGSCLQAAVHSAGKPYVQSEIGGGAGCNVETLSIATTGCHNVLRQVGVLKDDMQLRASRMLEVRDDSFYVYAAVGGLLEPQARLGNEVWHGDSLACIVDPDNTGSEPHTVPVPRNGVLLAMRHGGMVQAGDLLAILADEVQR